uniref:Uncharacterized protein n=1 Tax=Stegastes partitus TaxID=144197 RepID=A0A3B5BLR6_9TELE
WRRPVVFDIDCHQWIFSLGSYWRQVDSDQILLHRQSQAVLINAYAVHHMESTLQLFWLEPTFLSNRHLTEWHCQRATHCWFVGGPHFTSLSPHLVLAVSDKTADTWLKLGENCSFI